MSTYFEAINDDEHVIIDDSDSRLCLINYGPISNFGISWDATLSCVGQYSETNVTAPVQEKRVDYVLRFTFTLSDTQTLTGIKLNINDSYIGFALEKSGTSATAYTLFVLLGTNRTHYTGEPTSTSVADLLNNVILFTFGKSKDSSLTSNLGLEIRNADGEVVFHSGKRYANIVKTIDTHVTYTGNQLTALPNTLDMEITADNGFFINSYINVMALSSNGSRYALYSALYGYVNSGGEILARNFVAPFLIYVNGSWTEIREVYFDGRFFPFNQNNDAHLVAFATTNLIRE